MVRLSAGLAVALGLAGGALSGCSVLYSTDAISSQTSDSGTSDGTMSGTVDAGPDGGRTSLCNASTFVFCDGFEDGSTEMLENAGGGSSTVASTNAYRGAFALHSSMPATTSGTTIVTAQVFKEQAWPAHVFMRLFAFLPAPLPPQGANLLNYLDVTGSAGLVLYADGNDQALHVSTFGFPNAGTVISSTRVPLGQWVCVELEVDSGAHQLKVSMNDNALGDLSEMATPGQLKRVSFGLGYNAPPAGPPYDAWFDEVAVNTRRIGCAR